MTAQNKRKNTAKHAEQSTKKGCLFKAAVILSVLLVVGAVAAVLFTNTLGNMEQRLLRAQYPQEYKETVESCANTFGVNEDLIYAVIKTESGFDETAQSAVGAMGLMQIMPETFDWLAEKRGEYGNYTYDDLLDPNVNIEYGTYFLSFLLEHYQSEECAVAAYNAGFVVDEWLNDPRYSSDGVHLDNIPYDETAGYVNKVESAKEKYEQLY